jgi:hypothetical protein
MPRGISARVLGELYETVLLLASEEGRIEDRLQRAYTTRIRAFDAAGLPADALPRFEAIRKELQTMYPASVAGSEVDQNRAVALALDIILFYDSLVRGGGEPER